ncbi:MAG: ACP S-malonyltransferase [bacterium]|nr:ACP S-malonyltransferase [Acidimicrobiia bacterium]MCY4649429.1 ACP S-malonyltransferase [bacterium]
MPSFAILFPGQGSQFVGMGAELFEARPDLLGDGVDDLLGWSLRQLCLEGPEDLLVRTERAQPALFCLSYALWIEFSSRFPDPPRATAGHSLGEYTALVASGVLGFAEALSVVAARGRAMADAADAEQSGMMAVMGVTAERAEDIAEARRREGGRLVVANLNAPGQVVMAGSASDLDWLESQAKSLRLRRMVRLAVAGAFHSQFMAPAARRVAAALEDVRPAAPRFPVYSNVTAKPVHRDDVAETLVAQVCSPVRFDQSLKAMAAEGVDTFVHIGPGKVTAGLAKRTIRSATVLVVNDLAGAAKAADSLSSMGIS